MVAFYHHYGEDHLEIANHMNMTFSDKEFLVTGFKSYYPSMIKELLIRYMPNYHRPLDEDLDKDFTPEQMADDVTDMHNYIQSEARDGGAGAWSVRELNKRYPKRDNLTIRNNYFQMQKDFIELLCKLFVRDPEVQNYMIKRLPKLDTRTLLLIYKIQTYENPEVWANNPVLKPLFSACKLIIQWINVAFLKKFPRKLIKCSFSEALILNKISDQYDEYEVVQAMHLVYFLDTLLAVYYKITPYNSKYEEKIEAMLGSQVHEIPDTPMRSQWHPILQKNNFKKLRSRIIYFPPLNKKQVQLIQNSEVVEFLTPFIIEVSRRIQRQEVVAD